MLPFQMGARSSLDAIQQDVSRVGGGGLPTGLIRAIMEAVGHAGFVGPRAVPQYAFFKPAKQFAGYNPVEMPKGGGTIQQPIFKEMPEFLDYKGMQRTSDALIQQAPFRFGRVGEYIKDVSDLLK